MDWFLYDNDLRLERVKAALWWFNFTMWQFCRNIFYPIFNLYPATTSCKKSEKINASIYYKTQKRKIILDHFLSKIPIARFFLKKLFQSILSRLYSAEI